MDIIKEGYEERYQEVLKETLKITADKDPCVEIYEVFKDHNFWFKIYARHASQDIFEKKKKKKKESHPFRSGDLEGKVLLQNTTCIGGDFVTNL